MFKISNSDFKQIFAAVLVFTISFAVFFGKLARAESLKSQAIKILSKYNKSPAVEIKTTKTEDKKALGTSSNSEGLLIYSKNKINFSSTKPQALEIIYNKNVWIIESPDLELDDKAGRKVTVLDSKKVAFITTISDLFSANEKFFTKDAIFTQTDSNILIEIKSLKKLNLKQLTIILDKKNRTIVSITLIDDIDSKIQFAFSDTQFIKKVSSDKFIYKKQKNDEVLKP